ncbi:MAG: FlgD immunoglobulin-like domain containing protein [candidate division WOR-3 bacterium]
MPFDMARDQWITDLEELPEPIYHAGAITYGQSKYGLENVFVAAQIEDDEDLLCVYSFEDSIGPYGDWEELELPEEIGPGVSITFRPLNQIFYVIPSPIVIYHGELFLTIGGSTSNFYNLLFVELTPNPVPPFYIFPPNDTILEAMKIFFQWNEDAAASFYQLQVDENPDFSSPIFDITTDKNIYIPKKIFKPGVYYWRTRSSNSLWSETRRFIINYGWVRLPDIPDTIKEGGSIAYHCIRDGITNMAAESIYCLVGGGKRKFYCYSIHRATWSERENTQLNQNDGSSITSCYQSTHSTRKKYLLAIFGRSSNIERHWSYDISSNDWAPEDPLPDILGSGASITFDWRERKDDAYLVIGGDRDGFYCNPNPFFEEEAFGQQSFATAKKVKILSNSKEVILYYSLETPYYGEISVYNLYGKKIKTLFKGKMEKGEHQFIWNGKDEKGKKVSSGVYFIKINMKEKQESIKIVVK